MAHRAVIGPLAERDFGDQHWLHPMRAAALGARRRVVEGTLFNGESFQFRCEARQRCIIETAADLTAIAEPSIRFVQAGEQRAEAVARAFGIGKAADHHFLPPEALGLLPGGAASWAIR